MPGVCAIEADRRLAVAEPRRQQRRVPPRGIALEFFNGLGGFADGGREYVVVLGPQQRTPRPWVNVVANAQFGFLVSEAGAGYTWWGNARENQLTPWSNDPVCDPHGEVLYLQDLHSGALWTPTAGPIRLEDGSYVVRHGAGYSSFEHASHGIHATLTQFVVTDAPVKVSVLRITNQGGQTRRLCVAQYVEWVLGPARAATASALDHRARCDDRSAVRPQPVQRRLRRARCVCRHGWTAARLDLRPPGVPRPRRQRGAARRAGSRSSRWGGGPARGATLAPC